MSPEAKEILKVVKEWFEEDPLRWNMNTVQRSKPNVPEAESHYLRNLDQACIVGAVCSAEWQLYPSTIEQSKGYRYEIYKSLIANLPGYYPPSLVEFGIAEGLPGFVELANKILREE